VWSILVNWGDLKRYENYYQYFKRAALADFKGFVEGINSAYTIAHLPAKHPDRKYTLKVVNNLQVFDLPNCGIHVKNVIKFFNSVTSELPDNTSKDAESLHLVRVLIFLIIHTFRILAIEYRPTDPNEQPHEHGPNCNHDHDHEHSHEHSHEHNEHSHEHSHEHNEHSHEHSHEHSPDHQHEHQHGPECNHDHDHDHSNPTHQHEHEHQHQHGPDCNHDHDHHDPTHSHEPTKIPTTAPKPQELEEPVKVSPQTTVNPTSSETSESEVKKEIKFVPKDQECNVCGSKSKTKCSACLQVFYCTKECQKKDWPNHKSICATLKQTKPK